MAETWLQQFEGSLQQLEHCAGSKEASAAQIIAGMNECLNRLAVVSDTQIWLLRPDTQECLTTDGRFEARSADITDRFADIEDDGYLFVDSTPESSAEQLLLSRSLAQHVTCVLQIPFDRRHAPRQSFADGAIAVLEIIAACISRQLLTEYDLQLSHQATVVQMMSQIHQCRSLKEVAATVVQDGANLFGDCRLTVLTDRNGALRAIATTGVREINSASAAVRAIEQTANQSPESSPNNTWHTPESLTRDQTESNERDVLSEGVRTTRVFPLHASGNLKPPRYAAIVMELFGDTPLPDENDVQQLIRLSSPVIETHYRREQPFRARVLHNHRTRWGAGAAIALMILTLWPTQFEVEVSGQIASVDRLRIFAPENGTINSVRFTNESQVKDGQLLLQLSNADLDLEHQRIQGEFDATAAQLASVKARRLTTNEPQLSSDEQLLTLQHENLQQQRNLMKKQLATLKITSPFAGTAFQQDPRKELTSRPVQRGQLLLEVVPENSRWQLELKIPDRLRSYVANYRNSSTAPPVVRFLIVSIPEHDWTTTLTSVDTAVQVEDGELFCHAVASLSESPDIKPRPGTSVVARINCGRRALGFVLFREGIEFWNRLRFAWL